MPSHSEPYFIPYIKISAVSDSATPWTIADQAPLSMGFSRQEYWSEDPPPGDLPKPEIEPTSPVFPALADGFFAAESPGLPK